MNILKCDIEIEVGRNIFSEQRKWELGKTSLEFTDIESDDCRDRRILLCHISDVEFKNL